MLRFYILVILIDTECTCTCCQLERERRRKREKERDTIIFTDFSFAEERERETLSFLLIFLSFLQESEDQGSLSSYEGFVVREGCAICLTPRPGASVGKHKGNDNNNISTCI